jgi:hypothetical protein
MQRNGSRILCRLGCLLVVGVFLAAPSTAQPIINPGVDLFETPANGATVIDFASNPIPADFFCAGSPPFTGSVPLKGVPLATNPPGIAGNTDTIVERLTAGVFSAPTGTASFTVVPRAVRLTSINDIVVVCGDGTSSRWRADVCTCGPQPTSKFTVKIDSCGNCGFANGTLSLRVCVRFTNVDTGETAGPITQNITLNINNMPWCYRPGPGETVVNQSFAVDTNCDGQPDLTLPPTSNFHPGWRCGSQGVDCWTQYAALTHCHPNYTNPGAHDHCINPVCGERQ